MAGAFDVLRVITVTAVVRDEVLAGGDRPGAAELREAMAGGLARVADQDPDPLAFPDLDAGESSTLSLGARHRGPRLLLMDEPFGRAHARRLGMEVTGVAGLLVRAKQSGLVADRWPALGRTRGEWLPAVQGCDCDGSGGGGRGLIRTAREPRRSGSGCGESGGAEHQPDGTGKAGCAVLDAAAGDRRVEGH